MTSRTSGEALAFVGSYAPADRPGIHAVLITGRGELHHLRSWAGVHNPSFLLAHPRGEYLYVVAETGLATDGRPGAVYAFRIERNGGTGEVDLVPVNSRPTAGDHPCHIGVDAAGTRLAVSNYGSGTVAVFPIRPDGSLGEMGSFAEHTGAGPNPDRQQGPHVHSSQFTPDGRFLVVVDLGIDRIMVYGIDREGASMDPAHEVRTAPGAGPRHSAFHPDGRHLFVVNELDNTVSLFAYRADDGSLTPRQTLSTLPEGVFDSAAADVHVSWDGHRVYVSNRGHDSLALYEFEPDTGLALAAIRPCGGHRPRGFALTPDASTLLVANQSSDEVASIALSNGASGVGAPTARVWIPEPSCVVITAR
jgi:6-phosphogluconolactonase